MRYVVSVFVLLLLTGTCSAQNRNGIFIGEKSDQEAYTEGQKTVDKALVIPFEPKMYMSGIDKDISMKTGMSFQQIRNNMRFGLSNELLSKMHGKMNTISLMHMDTGNVEEELWRYLLTVRALRKLDKVYYPGNSGFLITSAMVGTAWVCGRV